MSVRNRDMRQVSFGYMFIITNCTTGIVFPETLHRQRKKPMSHLATKSLTECKILVLLKRPAYI